jgi:hypothetical protein
MSDWIRQVAVEVRSAGFTLLVGLAIVRVVYARSHRRSKLSEHSGTVSVYNKIKT